MFTSHTAVSRFDEADIEVFSFVDQRRRKLHRGGTYGRYLAGPDDHGYLVYVNRGALFAVPFDLSRLEVNGTPTPVVEDVFYSPAFGSAEFDYAASRTGKIVVMGGVTPGQTTDAVAAVLAERSGASLLVNLTSVDGIYSTDPRKDPRAERFSRITHDRLVSLIAGARLDAGANTVIDLVAAKVLERSGIPLLVLDGRDPDTLYRAVCTGSYDGTLVSRGESPPLPL